MPLQFNVIAQIHTRMPVILPDEDHAKWLGEAEDGDLKASLKPFPAVSVLRTTSPTSSVA